MLDRMLLKRIISRLGFIMVELGILIGLLLLRL